jgi:hypothetical protein
MAITQATELSLERGVGLLFVFNLLLQESFLFPDFIQLFLERVGQLNSIIKVKESKRYCEFELLEQGT